MQAPKSAVKSLSHFDCSKQLSHPLQSYNFVCSTLTTNALRNWKEQVGEVLTCCHPSSAVKKQKGINNPVDVVRKGAQTLALTLSWPRHKAQSIHNKLPPYPKRVWGSWCPKQGHGFLIPLHRFPQKMEIRFLHLLRKTSTRWRKVLKPSCANWPRCQLPPKAAEMCQNAPSIPHTYLCWQSPKPVWIQEFCNWRILIVTGVKKEINQLCIYAYLSQYLCFQLKKNLIYLNQF